MSFFYTSGFGKLTTKRKIDITFYMLFLGCAKRPVSSEEWLFSLTHKVTNSSLKNSIRTQGNFFALCKPSENIVADMCPKQFFVSSEECFSQNVGL